jgi:demethylmenaquinone methyltransferase / 2-methoxy-6-polyprenyl-1,4-benzoquinol methylase
VGPVTVRSGTLPPEGVRTMFDRIAPVYDAMNHAMTIGLDRRWRRLAAEAVVHPGDRVLDVCCGTGDLAISAREAGGEVTGLDFSERMLERARRKAPDVEWLHGDALALPFEDEAFDTVTVGFGVRNLDDLEAGLRELARVLRPGGRLAVLEITRPSGILRSFFRLWFDVLVPLAGKLLPGGGAYSYLPASVRRFPGPDDLARALERSGFEGVSYRRLGGGIVALHVANVPRVDSGGSGREAAAFRDSRIADPRERIRDLRTDGVRR